MSDILCVTNRKLLLRDNLTQLEKICAGRPAAVILREKDLSEQAYRARAQAVLEVCRRYGVPCILHTFVQTALELGISAIHLPLPILRTLSAEEKIRFSVLGASCHSVEDALEAQQLGCTYITAGHVFATDCKKGLPPRGLDFLEQVCHTVTIPVYAIGGINPGNYPSVLQHGAQGACLMSSLMTADDPKAYLDRFQQEKEPPNVSEAVFLPR